MSMFPFELSDAELYRVIDLMRARVDELHKTRRGDGGVWGEAQVNELKELEAVLARAKGVLYGRTRFGLK
jgi:hypothetical protein